MEAQFFEFGHHFRPLLLLSAWIMDVARAVEFDSFPLDRPRWRHYGSRQLPTRFKADTKGYYVANLRHGSVVIRISIPGVLKQLGSDTFPKFVRLLFALDRVST